MNNLIAENDILNRKYCTFKIFDFLGPKHLLKMNLICKLFYDDIMPHYMLLKKVKLNKQSYLFVSENGNILYGVPYINSGESEDYYQLKSKLFSLKEIKEYLGEPTDMNYEQELLLLRCCAQVAPNKFIVFTKSFDRFYRGLEVELNEKKEIKSVNIITNVPQVQVKYPYLKLKMTKDGVSDYVLVVCDYNSIEYLYNLRKKQWRNQIELKRFSYSSYPFLFYYQNSQSLFAFFDQGLMSLVIKQKLRKRNPQNPQIFEQKYELLSEIQNIFDESFYKKPMILNILIIMQKLFVIASVYSLLDDSKKQIILVFDLKIKDGRIFKILEQNQMKFMIRNEFDFLFNSEINVEFYNQQIQLKTLVKRNNGFGEFISQLSIPIRVLFNRHHQLMYDHILDILDQNNLLKIQQSEISQKFYRVEIEQIIL